jgi:transposase
MAKALSVDFRRRVVNAIERGLSCRQAAQRFGVSASSAICWRERLEGNVAPKNQGDDRRPRRIEAEAELLLGAVAETPDITARRTAGKAEGARRQRRHWRFFERRRITFKRRRRLPPNSNAMT